MAGRGRQGLWRFTGRAAQMYRGVANGLLREVVATGLGIQQWDPPVTVRAKLEAGLGGWFGTGEAGHEQAHLVGYWLGWDMGDSRHAARLRHDPQGLRERASTHLAEYFSLLAQERPVVILLEDLHWADDASLSWLEAAEHLLRGSPVLAVATARPSLLERHPDWGQGLKDSVRLLLEPLSRRDSGSLLAELLRHGGAIPESLRKQLLDATEGNPFHLEEVVKWLVESGVIVADHGAWRVRAEHLDTARGAGDPARSAPGSHRRADPAGACGPSAGIGRGSGVLGGRRGESQHRRGRRLGHDRGPGRAAKP